MDCRFLTHTRLIWAVALVLSQTTCYSFDVVYSNHVTMANGDMNMRGNGEAISDEATLQSMLNEFMHSKKIVKQCTAGAIKKTLWLNKTRRETDKSVLRKNYQILQHGERSIVKENKWLSAMKSGFCSRCVLKNICDHPPQFLSSSCKNKAECRKRVLKLAFLIPDDEQKSKCDRHQRFRSINGSCNNLDNPDWGAALTAFQRIAGPDYADQFSEPRRSQSNQPLPNARDVSRKVHGTSNGDGANPDSKTLSHLAMIWGQFLDHDITLAEATGINCELGNDDPECVNIEIPEDDDIFRKRKVDFIEVERDAPFNPSRFCKLAPREHVNRLTAFVDGSQIYGADDELSENLKGNGGQLRDMPHPRGCPFKNMLPKQSPDLFCVSKDPRRPCFKSGDDRTNENQGLMSMHTLWLRQHNRLATRLGKINNWDATRIYQETRKIIGAQLQVVTYNEFLPLILGDQTMDDFNLKLLKGKTFFEGYKPDENPSIFAAFAVAAYRFGHSLVQEEFRRFSQRGFERKYCKKRTDEFSSIPLKDFGNPFYLYEKCQGGIDSIFRGLMKNPAAKADGKFSSSVQENLFRGPGDLSDLVAINIQRSRERGVPSYITYRNSGVCDLNAEVKSFDDLAKIGFLKEDIDKLKYVYEDVRDVDLFTGGLLEQQSKSTRGGVLGPTFQCLIAEQFRRLRVGDRFWHENGPDAKLNTHKTAFTRCQLEEIRKTSLAKVICSNSDNISAIPKNVLSLVRGFVKCNELPDLNLEAWDNSFECK